MGQQITLVIFAVLAGEVLKGPQQFADMHALTEIENAGSLTDAVLDCRKAWSSCEIDPHVRRLAAQCALDWFAVTIAGVHSPMAKILFEQCLEEATNGRSRIFGLKKSFGPRQAALANGLLGHALDFDDVNLAATAHITAAVFPAALACAQSEETSGDRLLRGFIGGYEAAVIVGLALGPEHYDLGFHSTGTVGAIGSAIACAIISELDDEKTVHAMGIAASQASGLKINFGTMTKPLHAARAAEIGVMSAQLARKGFTSSPHALHGENGFIDAHTRSRGNPIRPRPLQPTQYMRDNIFKYSSACFGTHSSIEACRLLLEREKFSVDDIVAITAEVHPSMQFMCDIKAPKNGLQAKFSIEFNIALALKGEATSSPATYGDEFVSRSDLKNLGGKVLVIFDSQAASQMACKLTLLLRNGVTYLSVYDANKPNHDLDIQEKKLKDKFNSLVSPLVGEKASIAMQNCVNELFTLGNVNDVSGLLFDTWYIPDQAPVSLCMQ